MPPSDPPIRLIYLCDESHIGHPYTAAGGLAIRADKAERIVTDIHAINEAFGVRSEVKWSRAKRRRNCFHKAYIQLLASLVREKIAHFHVRFIPFDEYDHRSSGDRLETDTISKSYYQLLLHRAARYYGSRCRIHARMDDGECTSHLPRMIGALNRDAMTKFNLESAPFATIEPRNSCNEPLLQLLDVSLGALTSLRNGYPGTDHLSQHKSELALLAATQFNVTDVSVSTPISQKVFSVWNVVPLRSRASPHRGPRG